MSHRYIRLFDCHCNNNSAYRRYNNMNSGGDTLIFNFNNCCHNMPTAHCGGFWGGFGGGISGFWSGVGAGLGFGAIGLGMSWLAGGIRNLCMTGSWGNPLQNLFGGGMGYGNYGNYGNPWGYPQTGRGGNDRTVDEERTTVGSRTSTQTPATQTPAAQTPAAPTPAAPTPATDSDNEVTIDGKKVNINDLDAKQIGQLTKDDLEKIKANGKLDIILGKLGAKTGTPDEKSISLPKILDLDNLNAIKNISDRLGFNVAVANNPNAGKDKWVSGKIDDIRVVRGEDGSDHIAYTIDCKGVGKYGLKYDVINKENNVWTISLFGKDGQPGTATVNGKTIKVTPKDYDFDSSRGCLYKPGAVLATEE